MRQTLKCVYPERYNIHATTPEGGFPCYLVLNGGHARCIFVCYSAVCGAQPVFLCSDCHTQMSAWPWPMLLQSIQQKWPCFHVLVYMIISDTANHVAAEPLLVVAAMFEPTNTSVACDMLRVKDMRNQHVRLAAQRLTESVSRNCYCASHANQFVFGLTQKICTSIGLALQYELFARLHR